MNTMIKIVLVDDEVLFRKGISFILQREPNFQIIFEASNGQELINYLTNNGDKPDIIMMDLKMPLLNGVETTKIIHENHSNIKVIALTSYNTPSFISNMIQVGACSYIVKNASPEEVVFTINEVANKGFYYSDYVMKVIHTDIVSGKQPLKTDLDGEFLTPREVEILQLICQQYTSAEIADILSISSRTVEGHRNNLLEKTKTKNIAGLVVYAIQNKIFNVDELNL
ncbi:Two-component system response regulatory protein, LuxR family [Flavobacterium indicum GPTSA100-9 = DSM 17447]|uniref:Two-component system response regulatory protein, LuxR family n=1 Tax=Flavobacterium indicum (strain DSM 17447 / CIP 109464 / GPTSA100-9) TaxID=1094466 RepID=H8XU84_FLAIG|nr:Two-component system response regulatory protein, LuxR family [Flavobacterium indicum GPTSA100-9 = DSM 17447]